MDDGFLIRQVLNGNRDAFRLLVVRYQRSMFRFLCGFGLEAAATEELAQEAFLRAYRSLASYDAGKATFSSWLFAIAKHLACNELAHGRRRLPHVAWEEPAVHAHATPAAPPSAHDTLEKVERQARLHRAMAKLPEVLRSTLLLAYGSGLSLDDIAAVERCSIGTVKSRLFRGRQLLRAALAPSED